MNGLSTWLHRVSTGWVTLVALVGFLLFSTLVLPAQSAHAPGAGDVGSPDTSLLYTPAELYRMAEAYGEEGRAAYVRARWTFDVIFPIVYTAFLATALSRLTRWAFAPGSRWQRANLVPVLGAVFDVLENTATSIVMQRYPLRTPVIAELAPVFTFIKWLFVGGGFVLLLLGIAVGVRRWLRIRGDREPAGAGQG
jgi:hypothetical protein